MTTHRLAKWMWMFSLLFLAGFVQGQVQWTEHYNATGTYDVIDNSSNCHTHVCFLLTNSLSGSSNPAQETKISSGFDGFVVGLGFNSTNLWELPMASTSAKSQWTLWQSGNFKDVAVRTQNDVYALVPTTYCSGNGYQVEHENGSNWVPIAGCLAQLGNITADNTLFGINGQTIYYTTSPQSSNPTWITFAGSGWTHVAGYNSQIAFATLGQTLYQLNLTNNTYTAVANTNPVTSLTITADKWLFITTTASSGNVFVMDLTQSHPTWVNLPGTLSAIQGSLGNAVFGLDSQHSPYHYLNVALRGTVNSSGYTDCGSGGCPQGSVHTITSTAGFPGGYFYNNSASNSGSPTATISASTYDVAGACDIFFGDLNSGNCALSVGAGEVQCTEMGEIFYQTVTSLVPKTRQEVAFTRVKVTPGAPYWNSLYDRWYYSNIVPECTNTSDPDLNPNRVPKFYVSDTDAHDLSMDISSWGFSVNGSPWYWVSMGIDNSIEATPGYEYDKGATYCTVY